MKYNDNLHIAETLVDQRKKAGKSQNDLAQYCGVSTSSVSKWERATARPSFIHLTMIADFYNITIHKLLTGKEKDDPTIVLRLFLFSFTLSQIISHICHNG